MKTAVIGEDADGIVTYNASLVALLGHYGTVPKACRPYRASTARIVDEAFTEEQPALKPLPAIPNNAVLTIERRVSLIIMELGA